MSEGIGWPGWSDLQIRAQVRAGQGSGFFWVLGSGWTYLSWQAGRGTREFLQTASTATAPGASWERRAWSQAAGSSRRPG